LIRDPNVEIPSVDEYACVNYGLNYTSKLMTTNDLFDTNLYDRAMSKNG
jgi:hypothetical protein